MSIAYPTFIAFICIFPKYGIWLKFCISLHGVTRFIVSWDVRILAHSAYIYVYTNCVIPVICFLHIHISYFVLFLAALPSTTHYQKVRYMGGSIYVYIYINVYIYIYIRIHICKLQICTEHYFFLKPKFSESEVKLFPNFLHSECFMGQSFQPTP